MEELQLATFTFSDAALVQIDYIRGEYLAYSPDDPPVMLCISAGWVVEKDGRTGPVTVMGGFWRRSEWKGEADALVQTVSGVDLIFTVDVKYEPMFDGKIIDYAPDRAFFLR